VKVRVIDYANMLHMPSEDSRDRPCDEEFLFGLQQLGIYLHGLETRAGFKWVERNLHVPIKMEAHDQELEALNLSSRDLRPDHAVTAKQGSAVAEQRLRVLAKQGRVVPAATKSVAEGEDVQVDGGVKESSSGDEDPLASLPEAET